LQAGPLGRRAAMDHIIAVCISRGEVNRV